MESVVAFSALAAGIMIGLGALGAGAVSYTHLTLPTKLEV